jgi:hypothetical protein
MQLKNNYSKVNLKLKILLLNKKIENYKIKLQLLREKQKTNCYFRRLSRIDIDVKSNFSFLFVFFCFNLILHDYFQVLK